MRMNYDLYSDTIRLAKATDVPLARICRETGLKMRWLQKVISGEFTDPGVRKIQRLHAYLQAAAIAASSEAAA